MPAALSHFHEVWLADFATSRAPGERVVPVGLVAREVRSGRTLRLDGGEVLARRQPPYPTDGRALFVADGASTSLGCHLALGWALPSRVLDVHVEFRNRTNGLDLPHGAGLVGELAWHGLDLLASSDRIDSLARRLEAMIPALDLPRALLRGRYFAAVARIEAQGVPIDVATLERLRASWGSVQNRLIQSVDARFGVFVGRTFRADRWACWLARAGIAWPVAREGGLMLDDDTFREMARAHPDVALVRELRHALSQLRLGDLSVGADGRNRAPLEPFRSKTGRNQPSSGRWIFGPSCWLRGLIKPGPGRAVAYVDWCQQEFGIAAALSGDRAMQDAYRSGDPYLAFGKQAGRIPPNGTKATHGVEREMFKACVLGVQYGMGADSLAGRIGGPTALARDLLRLHRETYPTFWRWSDGAQDHAMIHGQLATVFGWTLRVGSRPNVRSLRNFPCQANGAEMLRLACCLATERGVSVVAPVHDALMVEGPSESIFAVVSETQAIMAEASEVVLDGFRLRSDAVVVRWPERYMDARGREFWGRVMALLPDG